MRADETNEDKRLQKAVLKNAESIQIARQRAERELVLAKEALEKKTEELEQQRGWFEVTLSSIGDAVITTDTRETVTFMNPVAERMTGWTSSEALGSPLEKVFRIVNEITKDQAVSPVREVLETGKVVELTNHTVLVGKNGVQISIEDSAAPIRNPKGEVSGAVMVFHDVTGRRKVEEALRESEDRFRTTFDGAAVGIAVGDFQGRLVDLNQKFADILGYDRNELRGLTFVDLTHKDDLSQTEANMRRLRAGEITSYALEKRFCRKDGATVWCRTTVTLVRSAGGGAAQFIGVIEDITERRKAEEQARDGALRLQLALAAGDLGNWSWDARTDSVRLGGRAAAIFGLPAEVPIAATQLIERLVPEDRVQARLVVERALQDRSTCSLECRLAASSTPQPWVAARGQGLYDRDGVLQGAIGVVQEISYEKAAEEARARLAAVVETSSDAILSKTLDGVITTWNQGAERIFGYAPQEVIGKPVTILIPPNHLDEEPAILERLRRGERIDHYETIRVAKDGSLLNVSLSVSPVRDHNGVIIGASKIARDITKQKRAEESLAEERRILELLNTTGPSIASQLDLQNLVQMVTDAATQLSGAKFGAFFYNVTNAEGESFLLFSLSGAPREAFEKLGLPRNTPIFNPTFRGEGVVRSADITKDPRYGTMSPHHGMPKGHLEVRSYLAVPVISRTGAVIGGLFFGHPEPEVFTERAERLVMGVASQAAIAIDNARLYESAQRELESRERAEAALKEADRRKDEFLATLAHELRNPLAPIRQAALVSKSESATEAQKRWSHDVIGRQVQHMALLLDDLLDISRITRGTLELRTEMTDLGEIVDAAIETARPTIDAKRHTLSIETSPEPIHLVADPLRLAQVLSNLLTNAAKYTDPGGRIRLRIARASDAATISVSDTGIGIPTRSLGEVFTMFSQVQSGHDRSEGGLGIGLALAKGLVELHGGTIEARSAGPGQGSEFTVRLPLKTRDLPERNETTDAVRPKAASRRVLIADDNEDAAESLAALLRMEGHEVMVVNDGREALLAFDAFQPEVALLDIGMPGLSGYEVAHRVRQGSLGRAVTLIAVTGWGQDSDKAQALAAGFNHHFTKPVEPDKISELLRTDRRRSR